MKGEVSKVNGNYCYSQVTANVHSQKHYVVWNIFLRNSHSENTLGQDQEFSVSDTPKWTMRNDASDKIMHCLKG